MRPRDSERMRRMFRRQERRERHYAYVRAALTVLGFAATNSQLVFDFISNLSGQL